jgi:hypothetical protein
MSLVETSPLGKFSDFDLTGSSAIGEVATAVRMIWRGQCYLALTSAWASPSDSARGTQFLNSVRDQNGATAITAASKRSVPVETPDAADAAKRLQLLKDLFDHKLITPSEYETKRKAVLDAL